MQEYLINSVADLRKEKNVTQEVFAEAIGVSRQTIIAIEKGNYTPSLILGLKIAEYFERSVEEIFNIYEK